MFQPNAAPWQQHQQQQQPQQQTKTQMQQQQQHQNANLIVPTVNENWQQTGLNVPTDQNYVYSSTNPTNQQYFNNYVNYQNPINPTNQLVEQVQQPQTIDMAAFQATQPSIQESQNFFDNNQNNNVKNDGWEDWGDWNDNLSNTENNTNNNNQQQQQAQTFFNPALTQPQNNIINDSFAANDKNWNWNMNTSSEQQTATTAAQKQQVQQLDRTIENENATNNIPNSVYVTQAKPVSMPSRQYALTPNEIATAATATAVEQVFAPPPEGFQNEAQTTTITPVAAPPPMATTVGNMPANNPFKRTAALQHHVASYIPTTTTVAAQKIQTLPFVAANDVPINFEQPENAEVLHENQEILMQAPQQQQPHINDERNQYLQTSHLSENANDDSNIEADNLPPPGLSRLVLGQPGFDVDQQRLVPGKEVWPNDTVGNLSLNERQADGEDNVNNNVATTIRSTSIGVPTATTDRNLYLVPGQSNGNTDQLPRVLTGFDVEQTTSIQPQQQQQQPMLSQQQQQPLLQQQQQLQQPQVQIAQQIQQPTHINVVEQRDIELDGENVEDQQQQQQTIVMQPPQQQILQPQQQRNEPPLEGAAAQTEQQTKILTNTALDGKELQQQANVAKDEQLTHEQQLQQQQQQQQQFINKKKDKKRNSIDRYNSDSEEADYSSDRQRQRHRRNYREGSVRSDVGHERDWEDSDVHQKERRRRDRHEKDNGEKEKPRDKYYRNDANDTLERRSKRYTRYDQDSSHEENGRKEKTQNKRSTRDRDNRDRERGDRERVRERDRRHEREHDEFNRRYRNSKRVVDEENSARLRRERERDYADKQERRQRRSGAEKHHGGNRTVDERERDREEYEDYRKHSSRNARESDAEKERGGRAYDPRYAAMYGYHTGQTNSGYGAYDPYTYYYDHLARFNPQAYSEMYKKYYGAHSTTSAGDINAVGNVSSTAATGAGSDHLTGDGRESVHSGRSSLQHDRER